MQGRMQLWGAAIVAAVALVAIAAAAGGAGTRRAAATPIGFGPTTVVDDQRAAGEPDVKVCGPSSTWSYGNCGQDNPYGSAPWGFSTTTSYIWRSEDQAKTFKLVPSNSTTNRASASNSTVDACAS